MSDPERMMRFGYLLSEIEVGAERLRLGLEEDVMAAVVRLCLHAVELRGIAFEVSNEALDKTVIRLKDPPPTQEAPECDCRHRKDGLIHEPWCAALNPPSQIEDVPPND